MAGVARAAQCEDKQALSVLPRRGLGVAWAWLGRGLGVAEVPIFGRKPPPLTRGQFLSCTRISSGGSVQTPPPCPLGPSPVIPATCSAALAYDSFRGTIASANNIQSFQQPGRHTKPCGIQARDTGPPSQGLPCPSSDALPGSARWPGSPGWRALRLHLGPWVQGEG